MRAALLGSLLACGVVGFWGSQAFHQTNHDHEAPQWGQVSVSAWWPWEAEAHQEVLETLALQQQTQELFDNRTEVLVDNITSRYHQVPRDLAEEIVQQAHFAAWRHQVDPLLLLAVVDVESSFRPNVSSHSGALGLTQVIPYWHPEKVARIEDEGLSLWDTRGSLELGAQILAEYSTWHPNSLERALQQYNGASHDPARRYSQRVMQAQRRLARNLPEGEIQPEQIMAIQGAPANRG